MVTREFLSPLPMQVRITLKDLASQLHAEFYAVCTLIWPPEHPKTVNFENKKKPVSWLHAAYKGVCSTFMWPPSTSSLLPQATMAWPAHGGSGCGTGAKISAAASPFCEGVGGADLAGPLTGLHVSVSSAKIHTSPR